MSYRKFTDRDGNHWEIRDRYNSEWEFVPQPGNTQQEKRVRPPGYENDPFEMSEEEVQKLLDSVAAPSTPRRPNPFGH